MPLKIERSFLTFIAQLSVGLPILPIFFAASVSSAYSKVVSSFKCVNFWKIWWNESMRTYTYLKFSHSLTHIDHMRPAAVSGSAGRKSCERLILGVSWELCWHCWHILTLLFFNFTTSHTIKQMSAFEKRKSFFQTWKMNAFKFLILFFFEFCFFVALSLNKCLLALIFNSLKGM